MRHIWAPVISGEDNIPDAPALFVANHPTMATDTIIVMPMLAEACGRMVRGMNDRLF
jgi:1-acyl-sn-glycerol-3-phosphate acyltransferase